MHGKADIVNIGNNKRWNKSDIRTKEQLVQLQKVHSNSAEAWAVEKASLTGLIEKTKQSQQDCKRLSQGKEPTKKWKSMYKQKSR